MAGSRGSSKVTGDLSVDSLLALFRLFLSSWWQDSCQYRQAYIILPQQILWKESTSFLIVLIKIMRLVLLDHHSSHTHSWVNPYGQGDGIHTLTGQTWVIGRGCVLAFPKPHGPRVGVILKRKRGAITRRKGVGAGQQNKRCSLLTVVRI